MKNEALHAGHDGRVDIIITYEIWNQGPDAAIVDTSDKKGEAGADELEGCRSVEA